jgi:hypothetical protein
MPLTGGTATGNIGVTGPAGTARNFSLWTGDKLRWAVQAGGEPETGSNTGTTFGIIRYNDAGAPLDIPLEISRDTGIVSVNAMAINGSLSAGGTVTASMVSFAPTGGYITGNASVVNFVQDTSLNRWTYLRTGAAAGEMQYIRGSDNQVLFAIDISGNVFAHGTFTPGGVMSYDDRIAELEARIAALEAKM